MALGRTDTPEAERETAFRGVISESQQVTQAFPGKANRIKADVIRWERHQNGVLRRLARRYTQALMAQSIVCSLLRHFA